MKAAIFRDYGAPDVLRVEDLPIPVPGPGEVLIRVRGAGINPVDTKFRTGRRSGPLPGHVGREVSGVVEQVGDDVTLWRTGDEVFGCVQAGGVAEFVVAAQFDLARKPADLDWDVAGALALAGQTAYASLHALDVPFRGTVLVSAACGGVGVILCQLLTMRAHTVLGTASTRHHDFLRSIDVTPVDYSADLAENVRDALAGRDLDAVFDNQGRDTVDAALALGVPAAQINSITHLDGYGIHLVGRGPADGLALRSLGALAARDELHVPLQRVYALDDVRQAFAELDDHHVVGKIVIRL